MPKKKKTATKRRAAKNDARGYGQQQQQPQQQQQKATEEIKTHTVQDVIRELSEFVALERSPPTPLHPSDTVRFRRKLEDMYDALVSYGFQWHQIQSAVAAVGFANEEERYLDWLCGMLPTEELPHLFTEGKIREQRNETDGMIEVMVASQPAAEASPPSSPPELRMSPEMKQSQSQPENQSQPEEEKVELERRKQWIMSQYQYEIADTEEQEQFETKFVEANIGDNDDEPESEKEDDSELVMLRAELLVLQEDVRNEANNYMRSKQEIKTLQKQVKTMKNRISKLEGKRQRRKATSASRESDKHAEVEEEEDGHGAVDLFGTMDEEADPPFDLFAAEVKEEQQHDVKTVNEEDIDLRIPTDCIPKAWTGATPRQIFEEWCKQNQIERPKVRPVNRTEGCRLSIAKPSLELRHNVGSFATLQHYLSVLALFKMDPSLQLYLRFPVYFRDLWFSWLDEAKEKTNASMMAAEEEKRKLIDTLLDLVPLQPKQPLVENDDMHEMEAPAIDMPSTEGYLEEEKWVETCDTLPARQPTPDGMLLKQKWKKHQEESAKYIAMLEIRRDLPIHSYRDKILNLVADNSVTILCAETGSGKTTQCSSFILEDAFSSGNGDRVSIMCTQPRRVAAISVAERVAEELGEESVGGLVGYSIRLETRKSQETRLLFCTTGIILRRLVEDPNLVGVSHLVLDEVHERQWQIDVLFTCVKLLLRTTRPDLKVILMSATLDKRLFSDYFGGAPVVDVPGRTFPVASYHLEDIIESTGYIIEEGSRVALASLTKSETVSFMVTGRGGEKQKETADYSKDIALSGRFDQYSVATQISMDRVDETVINYDLIECLLQYLCLDETPSLCSDDIGIDRTSGAILIFLPGVGEINALVNRLQASKSFGDTRKFKILALHSAVTSSQQKQAFKVPGHGCTKIVVSTNIAETSVTIPDVVYGTNVVKSLKFVLIVGISPVIDSGRVKEIKRDRRSGGRRLIATWTSRAGAKQRSGRAGRVREGYCFKLYSSHTEKSVMRSNAEPELHRIPLEEVCLAILASSLSSDCRHFINSSPEPPPVDAIDAAIETLKQIGAISQIRDGLAKLTPLGEHLAQLPVDSRLGKMLIYGAIFGCVDPILTVVAALSAAKSPFLSGNQPENSLTTFIDSSSDFVSFVNVFKSFREAIKKGKGSSFCRERNLNSATLREMMASRKQYADHLRCMGFLGSLDSTDDEVITKCRASRHGSNLELVNNVICAGLFPNVARFNQEETKMVFHRSERLHVNSLRPKTSQPHPSEWLVFYEKFGTERRTMISTTAYINPLSLLLFGNSMVVHHTKRQAIIDGWIELHVAAKTALTLDGLKKRLSDLLEQAINSRKMQHNADSDKLIDLVAVLLSK